MPKAHSTEFLQKTNFLKVLELCTGFVNRYLWIRNVMVTLSGGSTLDRLPLKSTAHVCNLYSTITL